MKSRQGRSRKMVLSIIPFMTALLMFAPFSSQGAGSFEFKPYRATVPNVDTTLLTAGLRNATAGQLAALDGFKSTYGSQATVRWNPFAGSPDVMMGFHTAPSSDTPENVARAFVAANQTLFGVDASSLVLDDQKQALGGYLLRFQQKAGNVEVLNGGLGFVMNSDKQIRMVMGSTFRDVNAAPAPAIASAAAAATAQAAIARFAISRPASVEQYITPAMDALQEQIAPALRAPRLNVFATANGYRLAWNCITFSRNPFGMFITQVDAVNGSILYRENLVKAQQDPLPYTADIYPNHPTLANPDTGELALDANGQPLGLERVQLRSFNPGTNVTGVNGTLTGPHALVRNVLATQQPFPQAAAGTWHFRQNNAPLEAQPNESDDLAEPAEHIDEVNLFFFINYLLEYVDDIHRRDDSIHSRIGQGDFPDTYPNSDRPLVGLPHFPNDGGTLVGGPIDTTSADTILRSALGLDNAFSLPVIQTVDTPAGPQKVVVNPTVYGHGYMFNDLGKDGAVAYHEGMHSISTPIAGLEGAPEGGALNEAQADLWAYTITDAEAIGEYVAAGARIRQAFRDAGQDPDSLAWIRSVHTTLKYSELGTRGNPAAFEVHRDGEIYVGTMWDLRNLMIAIEPQQQFNRPAFRDGQPTRAISLGQETWERLHLGSLYIIGLTSPDTFVKTRDAVIEADRILYPTNSSDLDAPGQHESLIWQVFASHEMGVNAAAPNGGRQTISTRVPQFAADQGHTSAPQGITVVPASSKSLQVSWQPVDGAVAYEVFKRKEGTAGHRQFEGATGREYFDGDQSTTGWSHVSYVLAGQTSYEDKGKIAEFFAPAGIKSTSDATGFNEMLGTEYAVRALSVNPNRQVGVSDLSAGASVGSALQDVTGAVQTAASNVSFSNGVFEFDQTLRNNGVQSPDGTIYSAISFQILRVSNPTVTVKNADNNGDGKNSTAVFVYNQSLPTGATSAARHLQFNDPAGQLFTFDAIVRARVRTEPVASNGSQPGDGVGTGPVQRDFTVVTDTYNGTILVGSAGNNLINGVDYVDVPFVAKPNSFSVQGKLDAAPLSLVAFPDFDFELRDDQGNVLATSGNLGPKEEVGGGVIPGRTYVYRVVGFANVPSQFTITSSQFINGDGGSGGGSSAFLPSTQGVTLTRLVRFTVNPLTRSVTARVLN
ncbi:MAG TPA: M36 family metallopeptidase [Blastocatellia bacterium]|nr:M36 family metallopeptidase [Blastocatellia bacterium]